MMTNQQIRKAIHEALERNHEGCQIQLIAVLDHGKGKLVAYHRSTRADCTFDIRPYDRACYITFDEDGTVRIPNDIICD